MPPLGLGHAAPPLLPLSVVVWRDPASRGVRHRLLTVDREKAVVDLEREDRQRRVGQTPAGGRLPIGEEPTPSLVPDAGLEGHDLVAVAAVPAGPNRMVALNEGLSEVEVLPI